MMAKTKYSNWGFIVVTVLLVCAVLAVWFFATDIIYEYVNHMMSKDELEKRAYLGDSFGSLNTLFSGLTVLGVFIAIYLQRKELSEARHEFAKSAKALEEQSASLSQERFEDTFFNLFDVFNNVERPRFHSLLDALSNKHTREMGETTNNMEIRPAMINYFGTYVYMPKRLYFRTFRNLMIFISEAKVENKKIYYETVLSVIGKKELAILFYYSSYIDTKREIEAAYKECRFFKDIEDDLLLTPIDKTNYSGDVF